MRFDLADLRLFVAILRSGSITGGAAAMSLALASASQRVSGMEAVLGVKLLERTRRGVRPTPAGTALLRHAQDILLRAERMQGELAGFATGLRGRIRLLANTGALLGFLPTVLRSFLAAQPGLDIALEERPSPEIVRAVAESAADLGIVAEFVDPGALELHLLAEDRLVLVVSARHRLADRDTVAFGETLQERFVGLLDAALETHLAEHAARRGVALDHRIRLRSVVAIGRMVESGIGIAILPASAEAELAGLDINLVPLSDSWARRRLALCLRSPDDLAPPARLLAEHIRAAAGPTAVISRSP
jgi:DNA-binding transcriptional LysR family regulator